MKNSRSQTLISLRIAFAVFASILFYSSWSSAAAQPQKIILWPLNVNPAVVAEESSKTLRVQLMPGAKLTKAELVGKDGETAQLETPRQTDAKENVWTAEFPKRGILPGLYTLKAEAGVADAQLTGDSPRSVWVMEKPPEELVFAHVSDLHVGDPRSSLTPSIISPDERRARVLKAADKSGAHFMLITGDIVSVPGDYKNEYPQAQKELLEYVTIPMFVLPGNHDLYTTTVNSPKPDGLTYWKNNFGPLYYSFDIGKYAFIMLDTYDWPLKYRNFMNSTFLKKVGSYTEGAMGAEQFGWLKNILSEEKLAGRFIIACGHHVPPDKFAPIDQAAIPGMATREEVAGLLSESGVKYYLAGHIHKVSVDEYHGMKMMTVGTAGGQLPPDVNEWGYDLCTLKSDALNCHFVPVVDQNTK